MRVAHSISHRFASCTSVCLSTSAGSMMVSMQWLAMKSVVLQGGLCIDARSGIDWRSRLVDVAHDARLQHPRNDARSVSFEFDPVPRSLLSSTQVVSGEYGGGGGQGRGGKIDPSVVELLSNASQDIHAAQCSRIKGVVFMSGMETPGQSIIHFVNEVMHLDLMFLAAGMCWERLAAVATMVLDSTSARGFGPDSAGQTNGG